MPDPFDAKAFISDFERAWNVRDPQTFLSKWYDANVEFTDPSGKPQRGTDALRKSLQTWFTGFSDMRIKATQVVQDGNDIAILQHCAGRHTGDLEMAPGQTVPATNRSVEVDVAEFVRVDLRGKIVRDVAVLDSGQILMQLGLLPGAAQDAPTRKTVQR